MASAAASLLPPCRPPNLRPICARPRRHLALAQIHDPIADDFYHHFWVVKGGNSQAKFSAAKPATISEKRKKMEDAEVPRPVAL